MTGLSRLLLVKIVLTIAVWCVPLLLFPAAWLLRLGFPLPEPLLFLRLLGVAYAALVLAYAFAWRDAQCGRYPAAAVWVGIISNGGACVLLAIGALEGVWANWAGIAPAIMWGSLLGTAAITIGLVLLGPVPSRTSGASP